MFCNRVKDACYALRVQGRAEVLSREFQGTGAIALALLGILREIENMPHHGFDITRRKQPACLAVLDEHLALPGRDDRESVTHCLDNVSSPRRTGEIRSEHYVELLHHFMRIICPTRECHYVLAIKLLGQAG